MNAGSHAKRRGGWFARAAIVAAVPVAGAALLASEAGDWASQPSDGDGARVLVATEHPADTPAAPVEVSADRWTASGRVDRLRRERASRSSAGPALHPDMTVPAAQPAEAPAPSAPAEAASPAPTAAEPTEIPSSTASPSADEPTEAPSADEPTEAPSPAAAPSPVASDPPRTAQGGASYYGGEFAGNATACGQIFDPQALTAAHRSLPCGTVVTVSNLASGAQVQVTITDRGPSAPSRVIDLSEAAFDRIATLAAGVIQVRIAW